MRKSLPYIKCLIAVVFVMIGIILLRCVFYGNFFDLLTNLYSLQTDKVLDEIKESVKKIDWLEWLTLFAILIALFREALYRFFYNAKLEITTTPSSELMHEVDDKDENTCKLKEKQYWYGIRIKNKGPANAKNVEVYFKGIESNVINDFTIYNAIPLRRSWVHKPLIEYLPPDVSIRWDVCYLHKKTKNKISFSFIKTPNALRRIPCERGKVSRFKCEIIAKADNAKTKTAQLTIEFRGNYTMGFKIIDC